VQEICTLGTGLKSCRKQRSHDNFCFFHINLGAETYDGITVE
jgi:hypothetical protein